MCLESVPPHTLKFINPRSVHVKNCKIRAGVDTLYMPN